MKRLPTDRRFFQVFVYDPDNSHSPFALQREPFPLPPHFVSLLLLQQSSFHHHQRVSAAAAAATSDHFRSFLLVYDQLFADRYTRLRRIVS